MKGPFREEVFPGDSRDGVSRGKWAKQSCVDEERDPVTGVHSDEINPDCPLGLLCHKSSLGSTELEVPAGHQDTLMSSGWWQLQV